MSALSTQSYKGTRDYYPKDKRVQNYIFSIWRKVSESYGYQEYGAPMLEPLEIYAAKSGQEIVNEQTYSFVDRGDRVVAIRPEMTPSISRMVAAKRQELSYPARLYSIANFLRYERPQRGREREFWQLNVDVFGDDSVNAEAEVISMANDIMKAFGAKTDDYIIRINNRKLVNFIMAQYLGLDASKATSMIKLFDRREKMEESEFIEAASEIFSDDSKQNGVEKVKQILNAKNMADLPEEVKTSGSIKEIQDLFTILDQMNLDNAVFDITLMRGFDYYTGMVFEVFDTSPENNRALFGGGRYDGLVGLFGAEPLSAVGFAPGGTSTENFLQTHGLIPELPSLTKVCIAAIGDVSEEVNNIARQLRSEGVNTEVDLSDRKLDKKIKAVIKNEIPYILFVGEDEIKNDKFTLRNITDSIEYKLNMTDIVDKLKEK